MANVDNNCIEFGEELVLSSISIDSKLSFENHLNNFSKHTLLFCEKNFIRTRASYLRKS